MPASDAFTYTCALYFLPYLFTYLLIYSLTIYLLLPEYVRFQAGGRRKRPNLAFLVF